MESPPLLSEDSGLIVTSGSVSSDITSELQESDYDEKSLSQYDVSEAGMCADNFNTVKKGPTKVIEPPPQFQDSPIIRKSTKILLDYENDISNRIHLSVNESGSLKEGPMSCHAVCYAPLSPRLSSSHSSLSTQPQADDSGFITHAISHDIVYNVPFDSDIYAVPIDTIVPPRSEQTKRKKMRGKPIIFPERKSKQFTTTKQIDLKRNNTTKRHSLPGTSSIQSESGDVEPMHMTLHEVRKYLHTLYSSSSESDYTVNPNPKTITTKSKSSVNYSLNLNSSLECNILPLNGNNENEVEKSRKSKKNLFIMNIKSDKKRKESNLTKEENSNVISKIEIPKHVRLKKSPKNISLNLKQTICRLFGVRRTSPNPADGSTDIVITHSRKETTAAPPARRALPPLPNSNSSNTTEADGENIIDFATSIQKVKDCGWYWGPLSVESAERILSEEPDGSFIVRDSSDDHYVFTLTFKLNGMRHVRIDHDHGNFCFGSCTMFRARSIVEFIEKAVETSRSGRYLFFLNLRPGLGPVRVQLLHPVSRFRRVHTLQHMARFVILKYVRRDLINKLPLPRRLLDYLAAPHYYSEVLGEP